MWLQVLVVVHYDRVDFHGSSPRCLDAFAAAGPFRRGSRRLHRTIVPSISFASGALMILNLKRIACDLLMMLRAALACVRAAETCGATCRVPAGTYALNLI